jgi:Tat protein translocase TatC
MMPFHNQIIGIIVEPYRVLWRQGFTTYVAELEQQSKDGTLDKVLGDRYLGFCRNNGPAILDGTFHYPNAIPWETGFRIPYELVATGGIEDIWTFMMAAMVFALALASPIVIWQLWAFIAAGLYKKERAIFYRYFPFMIVLLAAGILFGFFVAVPTSLGFLLRLMVIGMVAPMLSVSQYFSFLFALTTALGVVFQLPMVMVALQRVGLVRHATMVKHWRIVVLAIFILAALITPPDPFSMMMMAMPTLVLYLLGLVLTWLGKRHESPLPAPAPAPGAP